MATIDIPDELYQRLLALGYATKDFYVTALEEALDRRRAVIEKKEQVAPQRIKPGPKKEGDRAVLSAYVDVELLDWLRSQMRGPKDLGGVTNSILRQAKLAGIKAFSDGQ